MEVTTFSGVRDGISPMSAALGVRYFSLARHALVAGLQALGVGVGGHVLMPGYICRDLLAAVHEIGAFVDFYPVDKCLHPVSDPADWPQADVVVAVNYFGFEQPLAPFRKYCAIWGARLIEDNAHGFLSRDVSGQWLGLRGDIGLFSLRKTFPMINGAALVVQATDVVAMLAPQQEPMAVLPPFSLRMRRALRRVTGSRKVELLAAEAMRWVRLQYSGCAIAPSLENGETHIPLPSAPAIDLFETLFRHDGASEIERRRRIYMDLAVVAEAGGFELVFPLLPLGIAPYGLPVYCDSPAKLIALARRFGLDCYRWPDLPDSIASNSPAHYSRLYLVSFL